MTTRGIYPLFGKRALDIVVSASAMAFGWPVFAVVAALVRWRLGSPVIFAQPRPGLHGKPFTLYKFRSMTDARDANGNLLPDSMRLTSFGKWLRSSSLDEIPELWNVLRGDMSLVGPRPLLVEYLDRYDERQARRHDVRPGITGWAQVNGRNSSTWEERFEHDVYYTENVSLWLDLSILARTVHAVLTRRGIAEEGSATRTPFLGRRLTDPAGEPR